MDVLGLGAYGSKGYDHSKFGMERVGTTAFEAVRNAHCTSVIIKPTTKVLWVDVRVCLADSAIDLQVPNPYVAETGGEEHACYLVIVTTTTATRGLCTVLSMSKTQVGVDGSDIAHQGFLQVLTPTRSCSNLSFTGSSSVSATR